MTQQKANCQQVQWWIKWTGEATFELLSSCDPELTKTNNNSYTRHIYLIWLAVSRDLWTRCGDITSHISRYINREHLSLVFYRTGRGKKLRELFMNKLFQIIYADYAEWQVAQQIHILKGSLTYCSVQFCKCVYIPEHLNVLWTSECPVSASIF